MEPTSCKARKYLELWSTPQKGSGARWTPDPCGTTLAYERTLQSLPFPWPPTLDGRGWGEASRLRSRRSWVLWG